MGAEAKTRLTPRQRLTRGLTYSTVGPLDITRGVAGLGVNSAQSTVSRLRRRYQQGRLARELAAAQQSIVADLTSAQEVVTNLPQALRQARKKRRRPQRPWLIVGAVVGGLAAGGVAFSIVRRSKRAESSPRPPSVDVQPRP